MLPSFASWSVAALSRDSLLTSSTLRLVGYAHPPPYTPTASVLVMCHPLHPIGPLLHHTGDGREASVRGPITDCTRHLNLNLATKLCMVVPIPLLAHVLHSLVIAFFMRAPGSTPQDKHQDTGRGRGRHRWNSVAFGSSRSGSWHHALSLNRPNRTAPCNPTLPPKPRPHLLCLSPTPLRISPTPSPLPQQKYTTM